MAAQLDDFHALDMGRVARNIIVSEYNAVANIRIGRIRGVLQRMVTMRYWKGFPLAALAFCVSGLVCADVFKDSEKVRQRIDFADSGTIESGYQKVIVSSNPGLRACESSFASRFTKSLLKYGDTAALAVFLDDVPIVAYVYDRSAGVCTRVNNSAVAALPQKRLDIARQERHKIVVAYLDSTKVETLKEVVSLASDAASLSGYVLISTVAAVPLKALASKVDMALGSALSSNDANTTFLSLPSDGNKKMDIKLSIEGAPYQTLGEINVVQTQSLLKGKRPDDVVFERLISDKTVDDQLRLGRHGMSIRDYRGNLKVARQECDFLRESYSGLLTSFDLNYLLESYLAGTHKGLLNSSFLDACFGTTQESELSVYTLKEEIINSRISATDQRGTSFMRSFNPNSISPPFDRNLRIDFAPMGFPHRTAGEILTAQNQREAGCYQFSKLNSRQFYFIKTIDRKVYYFKTSVDQAYTIEQEERGNSSVITSIVVADEMGQLGDNGEYAMNSERCIKNYEFSSRS